MKKVFIALFMLAFVFGASNRASAWTDMAYRGENNAWGTTALTYENGIWRGSIVGDDNDANSEFKLYASDGATWFSNSGFINDTSAQTIGTDAPNMSFNEVAGNYYTFTVIDASNLAFAFQETASAPVSITTFSSEVSNGGSFDPVDNFASSSVQNNVNTVSITLNSAPSAGENVYIYYSTDNFASQANSDIVQASGAGTSWTANIGAQDENATVTYYVLTSTFSEANLDSVGAEIDVLLRALDENKASAQSYTIYDLGDSFHIPTQTAGGAGEDMLTGGNGATEQDFDGTELSATVYSGNVFQNVGEAADQSAYTLYYRINFGGWNSVVGAFDNTSGNDKYWSADIDLTGAPQGALVQYYLAYNYTTGEDTTFVYSNGGGASRVSGNETLAQANTFSFSFGDAPISSVPEPNTISMAVLAGSLLLSWRHRIRMTRKQAVSEA